MDMKKALEAIKSEMKPSMGCTEPVAIGLAVSRACALLEKPATHLDMVISSNIFKNAYSVQIPNAGTNGIELSCVLGCLLADPDNTMEIFAKVKPEHVEKGQKLVEEGFVTVKVLKSSQFYIECVATNETERAHTITEDAHDNLVYSEKDGKVLLDNRKEDVAEEETHEDFDITQYTFADFLKMAEEVDNNGELRFGESHIMCNLFTIDAIEKISKEPLIYHSAFKKNSYIDENGKEVIPTEPNSYKFEAFIFDSFELFDDIAILRGKREDDFAPVKNKEGVDSPKTAKELYEKYWERN